MLKQKNSTTDNKRNLLYTSDTAYPYKNAMAFVDQTNLSNYLDTLLDSKNISDYAPNGLQVEGKKKIAHIVTGVTASLALIEKAIALKADAILVHHGYFWKNEVETICDYKAKRIKKLLKENINLYGYHLPLDIHPEFGNNVQLAKHMHWNIKGPIPLNHALPLVLEGQLEKPLSLDDFGAGIAKTLDREPMIIPGQDKNIQNIAWCTGGAQSFIYDAAKAGVDAYISGEISESTVHIAREMGIAYIAAGHHATERYGVMALGTHLAQHFNIKVQFVDIDNPA